MHELPPSARIENLSSILAVNIKADTDLNILDDKRDFCEKIKKAIRHYDGQILSWINTEIIILFTSNITSEKHASRAFFCYHAISQIATSYHFTMKAFLHSAPVQFDGDICLDSVPHTTRDIFYSEVLSQQEPILFSEDATYLLERDFIFRQTHKKQKWKFYALNGTKSNMPCNVFAGRKTEQEFIHKSLAANHHTCVCGPAGIGKTSLIEYCLDNTNSHIIRCSFYKNTYESLYQQIFDELLTYIRPEPTPYALSKKDIIKNIVELNIDEEGFLHDLYEEAYLKKDHLQLGPALFLKCLKKIIPRQKICLFFDDIQWAADEFENFCHSVIQDNIRIISTSRTPPKNKEACVVIFLKPLLPDDILHIAQELIPYDMITQNLIDKISKETSGNPYYLREILKSLLKNTPDEHNDISADVSYQIPFSLKNLINHQIAFLSDDLRLTLEICSCIQQKFSVDLIQSLCKRESYEVRKNLNDLCDADFLRFSMRTNSYEFIHSLKEKSVYENIPKVRRLALHKRIALSLMNQDKATSFSLLSQQLFNAELWKESYKSNLRDARVHIKNLAPRLAMEAILRCMTSANKMKALTKIRKIRLQLMLNTVCFIFGEVKTAQKFITPIKDLFSNPELLRYPQVWNAALNELTFFYWISAKYDQALEIIRDAELNFSSVVNDATLGALKIRRIGIYSDIGRFDEANKEIDSLLSLETQNSFDSWTSIFPVHSVLYALKCRNHAYIRQYDAFEISAFKALKLSATQTTSSAQIFTLCYVADGYIQFQKFDRAAELLDQAINLMNSAHIYVLKSYAMTMMGYCKATNGDSKAINYILNAIYDAQVNGRLGRLPLFYFYLAKSLPHASERSSAKRYLMKGLKLAKNQGEYWIYNQIIKYADSMNIQLEKAKAAKENVVNFFDYTTAKKNGNKS